MRVGSVGYSCCQGLGLLLKSFHDAGIVNDVVVIDRVGLKERPFQPHWFPGAEVVSSRDRLPGALVEAGRRLIDRCDVLLFFETPFEWGLLDYARQEGKKTVLCPMLECMPDPLPAIPDLMLCPSKWELLQYHSATSMSPEFTGPCVFLPIPVEGVPWRQRTRAEVFLHNAGHGGLLNRNGTGVLLDAMRYVKSPIKLIVRTQKRLQWGVDDPRVDVHVGTVPFERLWEIGDVLVHAHSFDGLSLPLQEARAAGLLVMAVDRFPDNAWLPREPLIPVSGYKRQRVSPRCLEFDYAMIEPRDVAATIDAWYGTDITDYSTSGKAWAEEMSWERLRPKYLAVLEELCQAK